MTPDSRFRRRWAGVLVVALAASAPAAGHHFWVMPDRFAAMPGDEIAVRLFVGSELAAGEPYPRNPMHLREFFVRGEEVRDVGGVFGRDPAGRFRVQEEGPLLIAYRSGSSLVELDASAFRSYLREEGLDGVVPESWAPPEERKVRERFSRCAKALVFAGSASASWLDQPLWKYSVSREQSAI